ncbi:hypothetical protein [Salisediminibacterium selenitireducens]|uniref:Uncharacterized protein n=1 Tax=Bacillus selenitireducens (strain ATCC 700615 / DSM 15326 / MLS10) TaxID=439292 RepID=D6Y187_BACIE|nr:hypothetical protein [Salisediminibacterium selenitireducens]ADH98691.1 hypothetical protein Bsel_1177 [[Bacillus] selenitireducens MLS10]
MAGPIPFSHTWPYEIMAGDMYVNECPFCSEANVLLPDGMRKLKRAKESIKTQFHMPCCFGTITALEADDDYLWAMEPLR